MSEAFKNQLLCRPGTLSGQQRMIRRSFLDGI